MEYCHLYRNILYPEDAMNKQEAIDILRDRFAEQQQQVADIDPRITEYFEDLCTHSYAEKDMPEDWHNVYELLGAIKFLRLMRTYDFNHRRVRQILRLREGEWVKESTGRWRHISGGLKQPGTNGQQVFRWQPFQVFIIASVFGFYAWVNTNVREEDKQQLLDTEKVVDGYIWDYRRLCIDYTCFMPRKTDKTGLSAFIQVVFFLL